MNTRLCPASPEVMEAHRVIAGAIGTHILSHHVVARGSPIYPYTLRSQIHIERRLKFVGVGYHLRISHFSECLHSHREIAHSGAKRLSGQNSLPSYQIHQRPIGPMTVHNKYLLEAVVCHTLRNVETESYEDLRLDVDCAWKVNVVQIQTIGNSWQDQYPVWCLTAHL